MSHFDGGKNYFEFNDNDVDGGIKSDDITMFKFKLISPCVEKPLV